MAQRSMIWRRYALPFFVFIPTVFMIALGILVMVRLLGNCMSTLYNTTTNLDFSSEECVPNNISITVPMLFIQLTGFGGLFYLIFIYYPFYMAFPHVADFRRRQNIIIWSCYFTFYTFMLIVKLSVPIDGRDIVFGLFNAILLATVFVVIPRLWKPVIMDRERNLFLIQMEHEAVCCDKTIHFRNPKACYIEYTIYLLVASQILVATIDVIFNTDMYLLILVLFIVLAYFLWLEKDYHFFEDYTYTYLLTVMPYAIVRLYIIAWGTTRSFMLQDHGQNQIALLLVYNIISLGFNRIIRLWVPRSVAPKEKSIILLFPFQFFEQLFQYFCLFSIKRIGSATFWVGFIIVLATNILDTTGLLNDLYNSLIAKFQRRPLHPATRSQQETTQVGNLGNIVIQEETQTRTEEARLFLQDADVVSDFIFTIKAIHQKIFCGFMVASLVLFLNFADMYLYMIPLPFARECSITCIAYGTSPSHDSTDLILRLFSIYCLYLVVGITAYLTWRWRIRVLKTKFPFLELVFQRKKVQLVFNEVKDENDDLKDNNDQLKSEREYIFQGHISNDWENPFHLTFMLCAVLSGCWAILAVSVTSTEKKAE